MAILKGGFKLDHAGSATGTMFGNGVAGPAFVGLGFRAI